MLQLFNLKICIRLVSHLEHKERKSSLSLSCMSTANKGGKSSIVRNLVFTNGQSGTNPNPRQFLFLIVFTVCVYGWVGGISHPNSSSMICFHQKSLCSHFLSHPPSSQTKPALRSREGRSSSVARARGWALEAGRSPRLRGVALGKLAFVKFFFDEKHNINTNCCDVSF